MLSLYETFNAIWYHLYNSKNVKNTHGKVLRLVKLQALELTLHGFFSRFLNCTDGTKLRKASHIKSSQLTYSAKHYIEIVSFRRLNPLNASIALK